MCVKTVTVLKRYFMKGVKVSISNGDGASCGGRCQYDGCHGDSCSLREGHDGPCVCGSKYCRKSRLNDMKAWQGRLTTG